MNFSEVLQSGSSSFCKCASWKPAPVSVTLIERKWTLLELILMAWFKTKWTSIKQIIFLTSPDPLAYFRARILKVGCIDVVYLYSRSWVPVFQLLINYSATYFPPLTLWSFMNHVPHLFSYFAAWICWYPIPCRDAEDQGDVTGACTAVPSWNIA
jgi:hypothetical protein